MFKRFNGKVDKDSPRCFFTKPAPVRNARQPATSSQTPSFHFLLASAPLLPIRSVEGYLAVSADSQHYHSVVNNSKRHCSKLDHLLAVIQELTATKKTLAVRVTIVRAALMKSKKAPQEIAEEDTTR
ncbi:hypothetical protein PR002_g3690 [Phytophthora rubi]|uniref:Uncharacterized protein n=1 Tax=Phytophthora rubi TaxID=129364 RepID=A0A6A3NBL9_9STRA|nr:hypothetical protein PR002_g3690 [Phytophthora rubi]